VKEGEVTSDAKRGEGEGPERLGRRGDEDNRWGGGKETGKGVGSVCFEL
jgi:hypothetical protein